MKIHTKKAAMEMSVGTIVTIVLLMSVLILGLSLVKNIFSSSKNAIDEIDTAIQNEMNNMFAEEGGKLIIYPKARTIELKKGDDAKGFGFSVKNNDVESHRFSYTVEADDISSCGSGFTLAKAESYLLGGTGTFTLGAGDILEHARLVKFNLPESAPPCTLTYVIDIKMDSEPYSSTDIFVTIK